MPTRLDKKHQKLLFDLTQVVGIGHGFKEVQGVETDQPAIIVFVQKKLPIEQLKRKDVIPKHIKGIPTDVIEVGHLRAFSDSPTELVIKTTERIRPAPPGVSIGHYRITAGTLGAIVYDSKSQPLILSNNHVLANSSNGRDYKAKINDPILQPGPIDIQALRTPRVASSLASDNILAKLTKFVPLKGSNKTNQVDCALARPLSNDMVIPEIRGLGAVKGIRTPVLGTIVKKSGRTSGVTTGKIKATNVAAKVDYGSGRILKFENQILTTAMSEPGDSGSLILDDSNYAIGLLFAGSSSSTLANPIQVVLTLLKVKFSTK